MKFYKLFSLACLLLATSVQAQDLKIIVNSKGKVGYADKQGNEVIKCQYDSAQPFSNGVAIVTKSGKSGIIDTQGTILLPLKYTQILDWHKDLFLIKAGKVMGLANHKGEIILPASYSFISKPNCYNKALIATGGKASPIEKKTYMANAKYGIINSAGEILIKPQYRGLYEFTYDGKDKDPYHEGKRLEYSYHTTLDTLVTDCAYLGVSNNGFSIYNAGIIDASGQQLLKPGLYYQVMQPQSGMVRYYISKKKETLCGYYNIAEGKGFQVATFNKALGDINFWSHGDFIGDIAPVNGTSWSFIDKTGNSLRSGYTSVKHSTSTGLWAAKNATGKWDVFDEKNQDVASLSGYGDINFPKNEGDTEIFSVMKDDHYGCINKNGETVIPFDYDQILGNSFDAIAVKKNEKWGFVTPLGASLVPTEYIDVILPSERDTKHFWVKKSDSLYYHLNLNTQKVSSTGYKAVTNFKQGLAHVAPVGMKIDSTQVNKAQMFVPNTPKSTIDALDMSKSEGAFGYLINTDDITLMDRPVSTLYIDAVKQEWENRGGRPLTETEKKNILLDVTRENRSYDLKSTLSEDEWNY